MTKKRCPSLQIHEYAAITQAGISPPNEIQSKWNTRPRECENSSTKKPGLMWCVVVWPQRILSPHKGLSVTKVTQRWTLATSFLKLVLSDAWYKSKAMRRWKRAGDEHEMTMSTRKKDNSIGLFSLDQRQNIRWFKAKNDTENNLPHWLK